MAPDHLKSQPFPKKSFAGAKTATVWGTGGPEFKSRRSDQIPQQQQCSIGDDQTPESARFQTVSIEEAEAENDRLAALFNSRPHWGDREPLDRLQLLLQFRLRRDLLLETSEIPASIVRRFDLRDFPERSRGGGREHEWMKDIAGAYLREVIGCQAVEAEAGSPGGRADLVGERPDVVAEIGNTEYSRAERVLTASARGRFLIVPFRDSPDHPIAAVELVMRPRARVELRRQCWARRKSDALRLSDISKARR